MSIYSVKKKEIVVCGQKFVVSQASTKTGNDRYMLISAADSLWNKEHEVDSPERNKLDAVELTVTKSMKTYIYPSMIAVTESLGEPLPTFDEFMEMPSDDKEVWLECVK